MANPPATHWTQECRSDRQPIHWREEPCPDPFESGFPPGSTHLPCQSCIHHGSIIAMLGFILPWLIEIHHIVTPSCQVSKIGTNRRWRLPIVQMISNAHQAI